MTKNNSKKKHNMYKYFVFEQTGNGKRMIARPVMPKKNAVLCQLIEDGSFMQFEENKYSPRPGVFIFGRVVWKGDSYDEALANMNPNYKNLKRIECKSGQ